MAQFSNRIGHWQKFPLAFWANLKTFNTIQFFFRGVSSTETECPQIGEENSCWSCARSSHGRKPFPLVRTEEALLAGSEEPISGIDSSKSEQPRRHSTWWEVHSLAFHWEKLHSFSSLIQREASWSRVSHWVGSPTEVELEVDVKLSRLEGNFIDKLNIFLRSRFQIRSSF